jgi:glucan phosphoethanolaminetransferase (alkaline phosphatase superfamily)
VLVVLELVLWLATPCAFLIWYTAEAQVQGSVVAPHLIVATVVWMAMGVLRLLIVGFIRNQRAAAWASSAVAAAFLMTVLVYYGVVVFGLRSWGRVISDDLITTYLAQAPAVADAVGLDLAAVVASAAMLYLVLVGVTWLHIRNFDWVRVLFRTRSEHSYAVVTGVALATVTIALGCFVAFGPGNASEPVSLTFFGALSVRNVQGTGFDRMRVARLDADQDAERLRYAPAAGARRKNVVLIVVDALRSDRMGVYGYSRDTTPHLDRLDRAGVLRTVPKVRAACASSACGITSLISSKYVHESSRKPFTLHEVLRLHGYRVRLVLGGDHTNFYELKDVYGAVDSYSDGAGRRDGYMNDDRLVLDRAAELPRWDGQPVLLHFHLMSLHSAGKRHPAFQTFMPARPYMVPTLADGVSAGNYYDNGVLQADAFIHELLATLRSKGYLSDTLVVMTSDHGEALGERGVYGHPQALDDEVLRIPLVLMAEGYTPPRLPNAVVAASQVDIAPTILAELGIEQPRTWSGARLDRPIARPYIYMQQANTLGFIDGRDPANVWKYSIDRRTLKEQAFNVSVDPQARNNIISDAAASLRHDWRAEYLKLAPGTSALH